MLKVKSHDPDLQHKGRVLAFMLLGMMAATLVLSIFNIVQGDTQYYVTNGVVLSLMLGLFTLNRFGFVRTASLFTVVLTAAGSFSITENLTAMYTTMTFPILIASSLLASWSGFVVALLMIVSAEILGVASLSLLILVVVAIFSYLFADSLDRAYRRVRHLAYHDFLTNLPNRTLFLDRLGQAIDRARWNQELIAVLFVDMDNFKVINDSLGHELGDKLLIQAGQRIRNCLQSTDTAARLGGDEFIILLENIANVGEAAHVAEQIIEALEVPVELGGRRVFISASVGIALNEAAGEQPNILLRNANVAMYEAKKDSSARYKVFDSAMYARALRRLELENELRHAIDHRELRVYYQPTMLLSTGRITGMEALVRWEHPTRGLIRPEKFIPLAEETGLIVPLGLWVLREACHQAREWQKQYPTASRLVISVNLSIKQFREPNLVQELVEIIRETKLDPPCLQLEITESAVAEDTEYAAGLLQELKGLGIRLALDDFGTGYSSLVALQRFPLDAIKIDQMFVDGIEKEAQDTAIVQLVINLAHLMSMQVIAEGVRTAEQLAKLRDIGCDQAQGIYIWEPLAGEAATVLLTESSRRLVDQHRLIGHSSDPGISLEGRRYSDSK